ncbi:expressed protein [Dictyostelium purpureum]|uniref:Expressed protein n=1 Tax=Dictyostelium purpureum TaxID=5786 RepID=F0ZMY8_DICPU|nr:uncharacterized protein DICPUDRAFT_92163 [Dictyostelium purpureum]EGC34693.1 expressed protein [Dictyostelium purpureum]|eukprot:XP_003288778.1 expressed protein [Dictyostelium purpureum]
MVIIGMVSCETQATETLKESLNECLDKCKNRHLLKDPCVIRCHTLHPFSDSSDSNSANTIVSSVIGIVASFSLLLLN